MPNLRDIVVELAIVLAIGLVLAALGPFGSFEIGGYGTRAAYWVPGVFLGYAVFRPAFSLGVAAAKRLDFPELAGAAAGVLVGAVPASLLLLWWNGNRLADLSGPDAWFELYVQVVTIGAIVSMLFMLLERRGGTGQAGQVRPVAGEKVQRPPFFDRLPSDIADDLVALEMEDHYVRAHSHGRSVLLLMRMSDAVGELDTVDGKRVHRSWWVARHGVEVVVRDGRGVRLRLRGGIEAPVARSRLRDLREAGWLD